MAMDVTGVHLGILGFGTYDSSTHPRAGVLLEGLTNRGDSVSVANVPIGLSTADRVAMLHKPWLTYRLVVRVLAAWMQLLRRARQESRAADFDVVLVGYLGHFDVLLARLIFPRTTIVLDQLVFAADTAGDRGVRFGPKLALLRGLDVLALRSADVVVVDTEENRALVPDRLRHKTVVAPVGAGSAWFDAARPAPDRERPLRVVFFGLFTPLQGAVVIGEALGLLADRTDVEFTMIGTGQDFAAASATASRNQGVTWVDWVDAADLPALVAEHDVCLGIFGTTAKARRVVPNKVYQGAAAGCAIVTSDTPPQRRTLGDSAVYVPPGDAVGLAGAIGELATERARCEALGQAAHELSLKAFAPREVVVDLRRRLTGASRPAVAGAAGRGR